MEEELGMDETLKMNETLGKKSAVSKITIAKMGTFDAEKSSISNLSM